MKSKIFVLFTLLSIFQINNIFAQQDRKTDFDNFSEPKESGWRRERKVDLMNIFSGALAVQESLQAEILENGNLPNGKRTIDGKTIKGPTIKSHPWDNMNKNSKKPSISAKFAAWTPDDYFYFTARSLKELIDLEKDMESYIAPLLSINKQSNKELHLRQRYLQMLGLGDNYIAKQLGPLVIGEIAVVAPDFSFVEGTSVAVLLELKQAFLFEQYLTSKFTKKEKVVIRKISGTLYTFKKREIYYFRIGDNAVLSSSKSLAKKILEAKESGKNMTKAGDHEYMRRLLPRSKNEIGFMYFSDAAIRKWLSPRYKINSFRRMIAQIELTTKTLNSKKGNNLVQAVTDPLYGQAWNLKPIENLPFDKVTKTELNIYSQFLKNYNNYWSNYFDPIGVQLIKTKKGIAIKTVVLPLIENSIYSQLSQMVSETQPVVSENFIDGEVFQLGINLSLNNKNLFFFREMFDDQENPINLFTGKVRLRIFDGEPVLFTNIAKMDTKRGGMNDMLSLTGLISFFTMPCSFELDHKSDIDTLSSLLSKYVLQSKNRRSWFKTRYVTINENYGKIHVFSINFSGISYRFYVHLGKKKVRVANKLSVLKRILTSKKKPANGTKSHLHLKWHPSQMKQLLLISNLERLEENYSACWKAQSMLKRIQKRGWSKEEFKIVKGYFPRCPRNKNLNNKTFNCPLHGSIQAVPSIKNHHEKNPLPNVDIYLTLNKEGLWSEMYINKAE